MNQNFNTLNQNSSFESNHIRINFHYVNLKLPACSSNREMRSPVTVAPELNSKLDPFQSLHHESIIPKSLARGECGEGEKKKKKDKKDKKKKKKDNRYAYIFRSTDLLSLTRVVV